MTAPVSDSPPRRTVLRVLLTLCGLLLIAAIIAMPLLAGPPSEDEAVTDLLQFFGRFHPVILHLPIGILVIAALYDFGGILSRKRPLGAGPGMLFFGAATAVFASILGFILWQASPGEYNQELVERHLWGGTAVAALAVLTFTIKVWTGASGRGSWAGKLTLFLTCGVMGLTSHDGGTLTHGDGYLTQYAPDTLRQWLGLDPRESSKSRQGAARLSPEEQVVYTDIIVPIFEQKCYSCHNADKKRGRLQMDDYDLLVKGGRDGEGIEPGNAEDSNIVIRMELPEDDEERMPPEGKTQITPAELLLIKWWLDEGASPTATLAELGRTPEVDAALGELVPLDVSAHAGAGDEGERGEAVAQSVRSELAALQETFPAAIRFESPESGAVVFTAVNIRDGFANEQLAELAPILPVLVSLDLSGTRVDDGGLEILVRAERLHTLRLAETPVTDAGLDVLARLPALESLNLYGTAVTDAGVAKLGDLRSLKRLYLWKTEVTGAGVAALQKELPDCEIVTGL